VIDGDLFSVPPERIAELEVRTTILGGEVVHGSEAVSASPPPSGG
jgi:predicted amidohydrolase YtcJ